MAGDVIDPLGADVDDAPVAHALKPFPAGREHGAPSALPAKRKGGVSSNHRGELMRNRRRTGLSMPHGRQQLAARGVENFVG